MSEGSCSQNVSGIGKTSVIIIILIRCLPRIHDSLLFCTSMHLTADCGRLGSSFFPIYCTRSIMCLCSDLGWVSLFFSAEFNFTVSFFDLYQYMNAYYWNNELMNSNKEIYNVLRSTVWCRITVLLLGVLGWHLWKRSCLSRLLMDVKLWGHHTCSEGLQMWTIHQECLC